MARKVFVGEPAADAVHTLLGGAPNPYRWDPATLEAGYLRRRLLESLLTYWFEGRVRVPETYGWGFHEGHRAFELRTELIEGRPARLEHPLRESGHEARILHRRVMRPLQARLRDAGFDGLLWQAGLGNPVAGSNFLFEAASGHWVWIDTESGVPALFPLDPRPLFTFYLPRTWHYRTPLFDHTDTDRLLAYLERQAPGLSAALGPETPPKLQAMAERLACCERRRRIGGRASRAARWAWRTGHLSRGAARRLRRRPARCAAWMGVQSLRRAGAALARRANRLLRWVTSGRLGHAVLRGLRLIAGPAYRRRFARRYTLARIQTWRRRGQMAERDARHLGHMAMRDESAVYLGDFGVHVGIKPAIKLAQYTLLPSLFAAGLIGPLALVLGLSLGGAIGRTAYTLSRCFTSASRGEPPPLLALGLGAMPMGGNAAFPLQLLWSSGPTGRALGRFIVVDLCTSFGTRLPIWGGPDTLSEHAANRAGWHLIETIRRLRGASA